MTDRTAAQSLRDVARRPLASVRRVAGEPGARDSGHRVRPAPQQAYRTVIFTSIRQIDPAQWDVLAGANAIARSHAYLGAVERSAINDCAYFYPVIFNAANAIVGQACVYTITTDFAQFLPVAVQRLVAGLRRRWPRLLRVKITECAAPLMVGHAISLRSGEDREALIAALGTAVSDIARAQRSPLVVIRDFSADERREFDTLLRQGYNLAASIPLARIRVRWETYEDYLASMRARYRKDVKRRLQRADKSRQEIRVLHAFAAHAATWAAQARVVYEQTRGFKREILTPEYYENMDHALGERSLLLAVERGGRLVAHGMVIADDVDTVTTYFGRDAGPPGHEWFQLINAAIRIGIERRSAYLNLGRGSYDAKSIVGAEIEPLYVYTKSTIAPVNWLMRVIPNTMAEPERDRNRIFRE